MQGSTHVLLPYRNASEDGRSRRRFHVCTNRVGVEVDQVEHVRVTRCKRSAEFPEAEDGTFQNLMSRAELSYGPEQGLEYEDGDTPTSAFAKLGVERRTKTFNSAAEKVDINREEDEETLGAEEARQFRSLAATVIHMSFHRSDVSPATEEVCRNIAAPTRRSWQSLKKAIRYLKGVQKEPWMMQAWESVGVVNVHLDSELANSPERKSTSGGMMVNGTVVTHMSRTKATRALSTADAEHCSVITGAAEASGLQSMVSGLGLERANSSLDRFQFCYSDRIEQGGWGQLGTWS